MTTNPEPNLSRLVTRILHLPMTCDAEAFGMTAKVTERIVVELDSPREDQRCRLADFIVAAIELDLNARGAAPPSWDSSASLEEQIDDQLYRARLLGAGGLALRFSGLERIADASGQLGEADSAVLRRLLAVAEHERLQIFLPQSTAALHVVGAPEPLSDWLSAASRDGRVAAIEYEPVPEATGEASVQGGDGSMSAPSILAFAERSMPEPQLDAGATPEAPPNATFAELDGDDGAAPEVSRPVDVVHEGSTFPGSGPSSGGRALPPVNPAAARHTTSPSDEAFDPERAERCAAWAGQLRNMNGPKLHAAVERAFVGAYLPLSREASRGLATPESLSALESWAEGFAQSYAAAFKTFGVRTKRPRMVRDVIELGLAWLNQLRARQCQLLVVDAMRFDLGQRLNEELARRLSGRAACADQAVLWAALPSNAESQHLGVSSASRRSALERKRLQPSEPAPPRIESVRVGPRELFRLDQISADLAKPGERESDRLSRLAALLADSIAPWIQAQPPDTLVVIFGDHGFHWQVTAGGTSPAQRGGALPEQVLVPASAWLLAPTPTKNRFGASLH